MLKRLFFIILFLSQSQFSFPGEFSSFSPNPIHVKRHEEIWTRAHQFSPDGKTIAIVKAPQTINIYESNSWGLIKTLEGHKSSVMAIAYSRDGKLLASGPYSRDDIIIWSPNQGEIVRRIAGKHRIVSLDFSGNGKYLASSSEEGSVDTWDVNSGRLHNRIFKGKVGQAYPTKVKFSPDGSILAVTFANKNRGVILFDMNTGKKTVFSTKRDMHCLDFNQDGTQLAVAGGDEEKVNSIHILDARTGKLLKTMPGHYSFINSIMYTPDGDHIASSSSERGVRFRIWNVASGKEIQKITATGKKSKGLSMSPDGQTIAVHLETSGNVGNPVTMEFYGK